MAERFKFIADPRHAWLEVPLSLIKELGIEKEISSCSYLAGRTAYLEEDVDARKLQKAYKQRYGEELQYTEVYEENTAIRNLPHFEVLGGRNIACKRR